MDSELLEPALVKLLGCIMREIAEFSDHRYKLIPYFARNDWLDNMQAHMVWKTARKTVYQR